MKANFEAAVKNAIDLYAETGGYTVAEVLERYKESEACRESIAMLVLVQAGKHHSTFPRHERQAANNNPRNPPRILHP